MTRHNRRRQDRTRHDMLLLRTRQDKLSELGTPRQTCRQAMGDSSLTSTIRGYVFMLWNTVKRKKLMNCWDQPHLAVLEDLGNWVGEHGVNEACSMACIHAAEQADRQDRGRHAGCHAVVLSNIHAIKQAGSRSKKAASQLASWLLDRESGRRT